MFLFQGTVLRGREEKKNFKSKEEATLKKIDMLKAILYVDLRQRNNYKFI